MLVTTGNGDTDRKSGVSGLLSGVKVRVTL